MGSTASSTDKSASIDSEPRIQPQVPNRRLHPEHSPTRIASQVKVRDVKISPDGKLILYQVTPFYRATNRAVSALWLAEADQPQSAIQLTSGEFNDREGVFHPDGSRILFLSDRNDPGKASFIYALSLGHPPPVGYQGRHRNASEAPTKPEPIILTSKFNNKGVRGFEVSPDGKWVAFSSPDEPTPEALEKLQEKNDARVIDSKDGESRLRVYNCETDEIRTLDNIRSDKHVEAFTWSPDSRYLLYRLRENVGTEWTEFEVSLEFISVMDEHARPKFLRSFPRSPSGQNIWLSSGHVMSLQSYDPHRLLDARTLHVHHLTSSHLDSERIYGVENDAVRILRAHNPHANTIHEGHDFIAAEVSHDTDTQIDIITFSPGSPQHIHKFMLFRTFSDAIWFNSWDVKRVLEPDGEITYVFAGVLSSGPRHEPPNVWSGRIRVKGTLTCLSKHLEWLVEAPVLRTEVIRWTTNDGIELSGLARFPPGHNPETDGRLPAVLLLHGGPYRVLLEDYMPHFCNWRELLASAGYLAISPNYRGSQGRGSTFAAAANAGIGLYDWPDCESMVNEVIHRGWADSDRLGVAGWSHGGSLAASGVTQTKTRFKAAVIGAGVTHWEGMVMESGSPELEVAIGQSPPWLQPSSTGTFSSERKTSPIHNVGGITTAILILHGEKDERVPLGQAQGFYRGLKRCAALRGRDAAQLVVYPREPHG
ncbi:hypothetical protein M413DRAFT_435188 [Hebeloma cylindrosporum]|uniref:Dipeptidyl-peptidase V n=1 Tax=Hebeloma cylindrosporum TaxID=76867 RepID=A0A0C2YPN7_HEBCY|nr:hypothetical protein M413DRAFT_435188 [Hebeloma cylindrosporum h7]